MRSASRLVLPLAFLAALACSSPGRPTGDTSVDRATLEMDAPMEVERDIVLAIHGGAGTILREEMTAELDAAYRAELSAALEAGYAVLAAGGTSLEAVEAAIRPLEDSPLFNAGRGAVLTDDGHVELDASVMTGHDRRAGAIAGARTPRHPITAARAVMEWTSHVLLSGDGADRFVAERALQRMDPAWFVTPRRQQQLERMRAEDGGDEERKYGTVGCVALDDEGRLAAGTSTGGMARKAWGRIGDSPLIGAGIWADDATCAVSCTGHGEFFIRGVIAHQIHARMDFGGVDLPSAARATVLEALPEAGGSGGCVALGADGTLVAPFTTPGMYRGWVDRDGSVTVRIHGDERH